MRESETINYLIYPVHCWWRATNLPHNKGWTTPTNSPILLFLSLQLKVTWRLLCRSGTTTNPSCPSPPVCLRVRRGQQRYKSCTMQLALPLYTAWTRSIDCWDARTGPAPRSSSAHRSWDRVGSGCDGISTWKSRRDWWVVFYRLWLLFPQLQWLLVGIPVRGEGVLSLFGAGNKTMKVVELQEEEHSI